MNRAENFNSIKPVSDYEHLNTLLSRIENAVNRSESFPRWDRTEILSSIHEIQVSVKNGGTPKYSLKMLLTYCRNHPYISGLATRIAKMFF